MLREGAARRQRAVAPERLGDRISQTPAVGHSQNEGSLPLQQTRHEMAILAQRSMNRRDAKAPASLRLPATQAGGLRHLSNLPELWGRSPTHKR